MKNTIHIHTDRETRLLDAIRQHPDGNIESAPCGGNGRCGKCRVIIENLSGSISEPSEHERFLLGEDIDHGVRLACLCTLCGDADVSAVTGEDAVIEIKGRMPEYELSPICGGYALAVDIGTTTCALYILDCSNGRALYVDSFVNPQREYGSDVISRIGAVISDYSALEHQGTLICNAINSSIAKSGIPADMINAAVFSANTTMLHLLSRLDPRGIANAPFTPSSLFGCGFAASELGLNIAPNAMCTLLPCFSAYVGGDICAGIAACGCNIPGCGNTLFIDIGTNGEMALCSDSGEITVCATAAGPAFEGAHIECGMGGFDGAISHITSEGGKINIEVIGNTEPVGICGSGLIDGAAVLLKLGAIDETGYLDEDMCAENNERFGHDDDDRWYFSENVYLSSHDIREIQLAKSAIRAGIISLEKHTSTPESSISHMLIAGGFGAHISLDSASEIGMLPPDLLDCAESVGNTAGSGAVLYALSLSHREQIDNMSASVKYIELSDSAVFRDEFIEQMMF